MLSQTAHLTNDPSTATAACFWAEYTPQMGPSNNLSFSSIQQLQKIQLEERLDLERPPALGRGVCRMSIRPLVEPTELVDLAHLTNHVECAKSKTLDESNWR